jgi:hypothetical protein
MAESISELLALAVGLVVFFFLWQSLSSAERLGRGRGRELRHKHPVSGSGVSSGRTRVL